MGLDRLSNDDIELVGRCLHAAVDGPFFPDGEFPILMGLTKQEVEAIAAGWPTCEDAELQDRAVKNVLNHLLSYPHGQEAAWGAYIGASGRQVADALTRWRGDEEFDTSGRGYFDRLT